MSELEVRSILGKASSRTQEVLLAVTGMTLDAITSEDI